MNQFIQQLFYKNTKTLRADTHTLTKMSNNNQVELAFLNQEELQNWLDILSLRLNCNANKNKRYNS